MWEDHTQIKMWPVPAPRALFFPTVVPISNESNSVASKGVLMDRGMAGKWATLSTKIIELELFLIQSNQNQKESQKVKRVVTYTL